MDFLWSLMDALQFLFARTDPNRLETPVPPKLWTRTAITVLSVFLLGLFIVIVDPIVR